MPNYENQQPNENSQDYGDRRNGWGSINVRLDYIQRDIKDIKEVMKSDKDESVSRAEFDPIKKIVYGLTGLILTGVVVALLTLIIRKP